MSLLLLESDLTLHIPQSLQITNKGTIYLPRIYKQCFTKHVSEKVSSYKQGSLCCKSKVLLCPLAMCPRVSAWNFKKPLSNIQRIWTLQPKVILIRLPVSTLYLYGFIITYLFLILLEIKYLRFVIPSPLYRIWVVIYFFFRMRRSGMSFH